MFRRPVVTSAVAAVSTAHFASHRGLHYTPRTRELNFLTEEVFDMYSHYNKIGKGDVVNKEFVGTFIEESSKLASSTLFPLYQSGDAEGCQLTPEGVVKTPKGFKEAYKALTEGGWSSVDAPEEYGGQDLPASLALIVREMMGTSNWSLAMYPGLSMGAVHTLMEWGSDEQKEKYLSKMVTGEWSGTMCLTEPGAGTDLSQVKTKAEPAGDGTYRIRGGKIFISAGEHDMTSNIVHIVLARLPNSEQSTKGISLFLVPRNIVKPDGSLEEKRNVKCVAIESKMGIKASATCQLSFDDSVGYLIGKPNEGLKQMFTFMNVARTGTALQGVCHAELAFQNSLAYARERGSMRALSGTKCPDRPNDLLLCHPNVRMHILFAKAISEGGRAFLMDLTRMLDILHVTKDEATRKALDQEIGFYTPIAKACLTEWGCEAANRCIQVYGGHGYIKGNGVEQIARDARISTLYEGTTGVQALDFIGRKVLRSKTDEVKRFATRVNTLVKKHIFSFGHIGKNSRSLWILQKQWRIGMTKVTMSAAMDRESVGAASEDLLMATGYIVLGYYWLRMAIAAQKKIDAGADSDGFYQAKVDLCNYFFKYLLPRADTHIKVMQNGSDIMKSDPKTWDL